MSHPPTNLDPQDSAQLAVLNRRLQTLRLQRQRLAAMAPAAQARMDQTAGQAMTFRQIGADLGVSEERARQIYHVSLAKLRAQNPGLIKDLNRSAQ